MNAPLVVCVFVICGHNVSLAQPLVQTTIYEYNIIVLPAINQYQIIGEYLHTYLFSERSESEFVLNARRTQATFFNLPNLT